MGDGSANLAAEETVDRRYTLPLPTPVQTDTATSLPPLDLAFSIRQIYYDVYCTIRIIERNLMPQSRRRYTLIVMLPLLLAGCASNLHDRRALNWQGVKYVAMGSSFAAGAGIGPLQPGTPSRCGRTDNNYPTLLAHRFGLALTDVSCGGAMTTHVLSAWSELPAQIDAVTPDTRLVTITIGGNDVGYAMGLMSGSCSAGAFPRISRCFPKPAIGEENWRKLEQNLTETARQVFMRAPKAKLIFVPYVTLVPPILCDATALSVEDADEYRALGARLADMTRRVALANGAAVAPSDTLSRDHTACSAEPWSHGMSTRYDMKLGAPWHPNREGHAAIAQALGGMLSSKADRRKHSVGKP